MKKTLSIILFAIIAFNANALTYTWPVMSGLEINRSSPSGQQVTITLSLVTVNNGDLNETSTLRDMLNLTGMPGNGGNFLVSTQIVEKHHEYNGGTDNKIYVLKRVKQLHYANGLTTDTALFSDYARDLSASANGTHVITHLMPLNGNNDGECWGLRTQSFTSWDNDNWDMYMARTWDGGTGVAGECFVVPPENEWCALTTPAVDFSFGTLLLTNASGASKTTNIGIECTSGMSYTLRLQGLNSIPLSNGMNAKLEADGKPLGSAIAGEAGQNNVSLTATLDGTPNSSGAFSGTGVLFVNYP